MTHSERRGLGEHQVAAILRDSCQRHGTDSAPIVTMVTTMVIVMSVVVAVAVMAASMTTAARE